MERAINIFSPNWAIQDSYGRIACELASGFETRGYHVNKFGDGAPDKQFIRPSFGGLFLGYPTLFTRYYEDVWGIFAKMGPRVAITMFESTKLLDGWSDVLNNCDAVVVPAKFLTEIFRNNGVLSEIYVHPLGISEEFLTHNMRRIDTNKPLTFLAIADRGVRKGGMVALQAFVTAFGEDTKYKLILKCRANGTLSRFNLLNQNIEMIAEDYSNEELAELYQRCDVMIFPTLGEGFGLPCREFAATGGIAIATNWSGTADNIREWGVPLPYSMQSAWRDKPEWYGKLGDWADVSIEDISKTLRFVADNFHLFAEEAVQSSTFVHEAYQWPSFVDGVEQVWNRVTEPEAEVQYAVV